jgi:hypothetical protein
MKAIQRAVYRSPRGKKITVVRTISIHRVRQSDQPAMDFLKKSLLRKRFRKRALA